MKDYKVKVRIPCEVYKDYYVTAKTKAEARRCVNDEINDKTMNIIDCSGDYDYEQLHRKATIKKIEEETQ